MIADAFLDSAATAATLLRAPALAERWSAPSALDDFTTGGLARHLANQVTHTVTYLAGQPGGAAIPLLEHFTRNSWPTSGVDAQDNVGIRRRSEDAARETTAAELADQVDEALMALRKSVPAVVVRHAGELGATWRRGASSRTAPPRCGRRRPMVPRGRRG